MGKDSLFNKWCWKNDNRMQKTKLDPNLTQLTKITLKLIQDLNVRPEIIKFPDKKNTGRKLLDIGLGNSVLDMTPQM